MTFGGAEEPFIGYGTKLQRGDGGDPIELFESIAHVLDLSGPSMTLATVDATHILSPAQHVELLPGVVAAGSFNLGVAFIPKATSHVELIRDLKTRVLRNFRLTFSDGIQSQDADESLNTFWEFSAFVTSFTPSIQIDDRVTASITLSISGEVDIDETI